VRLWYPGRPRVLLGVEEEGPRLDDELAEVFTVDGHVAVYRTRDGEGFELIP
jgi:hypothetical protein